MTAKDLDALAGGALSAVDLMGPESENHDGSEDFRRHWIASGTYLWRAIRTARPLREQQRPLFDPDAFSTQ